jgi:hypothetical protein
VFAVQAQCAFLEWLDQLHEPLLQWTRKNYAATLSSDRALIDAVALEFDGCIRERLDESRASRDDSRDDAITRLLMERVDGRPLTDEQIITFCGSGRSVNSPRYRRASAFSPTISRRIRQYKVNCAGSRSCCLPRSMRLMLANAGHWAAIEAISVQLRIRNSNKIKQYR